MDFMQRDLEQRIADGGIKFDLLALLDRPCYPTLDVTVRWPDQNSRESVRLGTITITVIEKNDPCDQSVFNPSNLADRIRLTESGRRHRAPARSNRFLAQRRFDLPVGLELAQRIHRPDGRWQPADEGDLQDQANDAGERPADGEEAQERQDDGEQEAHGIDLSGLRWGKVPSVAVIVLKAGGARRPASAGPRPCRASAPGGR